jgi:hypothetical protein
MEIEMKATIAAFALILVAVSPTFAANGRHLHSDGRYLHEGRNSAYISQSGFYGTTFYGTTDTTREGMIHAN